MRVALFDAIDADPADLLPVGQCTVTRAPASEVREFCERWHYTGTGGNAMWSYGLWSGSLLLGVIAYNLPTMDTCESVFGPEHWRSVVHMGRLVCADVAPRCSESRLIGQSLQMLRRDQPHVRAVLTYAAADQGHIGTVYQATNALYTGLGGDAHYYLDRHGVRRGTFLDGKHVSKRDAIARGWIVHKGGRKHRYVYLLGSRSERRTSRAQLLLPVLPYPRREDAAA